jgi:hypothetical protein
MRASDEVSAGPGARSPRFGGPVRLGSATNGARRLLGFGSVLLAAIVVVGCGSSGGTSGAGNKTTFCQDLSTVAKTLTAAIGSPPGHLVAVLKADQASINYINTSMPGVVAADAKTFGKVLNSYIAADRGVPLTFTASQQAAGSRVLSYCGLNPNGTPAGSPTGTTS